MQGAQSVPSVWVNTVPCALYVGGSGERQGRKDGNGEKEAALAAAQAQEPPPAARHRQILATIVGHVRGGWNADG